MKYERIFDREKKSKITEEVLRDLPKWFGIEESTQEYIEDVKTLDFYSVCNAELIGFMAIKEVYSEVANLHVLGIKKAYHKQGVGTMLYEYVEKNLINQGYKYVSVYTLSEKHSDLGYKKTRHFYEKVGFSPVFESATEWGEKNPFLLMIKKIGN